MCGPFMTFPYDIGEETGGQDIQDAESHSDAADFGVITGSKDCIGDEEKDEDAKGPWHDSM
jgi:hypothetical protein